MPDNKFIEVVRTIPSGARLVRVAYIWPCFNCGSALRVDRETFRLLESRVMIGVSCGGCLPPPEAGSVRAAA